MTGRTLPGTGITRADPWLCWLCGRPGTSETGTGWHLTCTACEVTWAAIPLTTAELPAEVLHMGQAVPAVDFTRPGALSSPA